MRSILTPLAPAFERELRLPISVMSCGLPDRICCWFQVLRGAPTGRVSRTCCGGWLPLDVEPGRSGGLLPQRFVLGSKERDGSFEVLEALPRLVDAGEPEVRDLVELAERFEDGHADLVRLDLGVSLRPYGLLDLLGEEGQVVLADRAPLACLAHAGEDLGPAERLGRPRPLDHVEARGLDRGEAAVALRALATAAYGGAVIGRARVDHPRVGVTTERTVHVWSPSFPRPSCSTRASHSVCRPDPFPGTGPVFVGPAWLGMGLGTTWG